MNEKHIEEALRMDPPDEPKYRGEISSRLRAGATTAVEEVAQAITVEVSGRFPRTQRSWPLLVGAAAAAVLLVGLIAVARRDSPPSMTAEPTTIPATTPRALTTTTEPGFPSVPNGVPAELLDRWVGPTPASIATPNPSAPAFVVFTADQVTLEHLAGGIIQNFTSRAVTSAAGQLQLTLPDQIGGCAAGAIGDYRWSLSPQGATLTLEVVGDACPARASALAGTWTHTACPVRGSDCLGTLESGRYSSVNFDPFDSDSYGQVAYTVPDGWASTLDDKARLVLLPPEANETGVHGVYLFADVAPTSADCPANTGDAVGAASIADAITASTALVTTTSQTTVSGFDATVVDISSESPPCGGAQPVLTSRSDSATPWALTISQGHRMRVVLVDLPDNRTMAISVISDRAAAEYNTLLEASAAVIESLDLSATP